MGGSRGFSGLGRIPQADVPQTYNTCAFVAICHLPRISKN